MFILGINKLKTINNLNIVKKESINQILRE